MTSPPSSPCASETGSLVAEGSPPTSPVVIPISPPTSPVLPSSDTEPNYPSSDTTSGSDDFPWKKKRFKKQHDSGDQPVLQHPPCEDIAVQRAEAETVSDNEGESSCSNASTYVHSENSDNQDCSAELDFEDDSSLSGVSCDSEDESVKNSLLFEGSESTTDETILDLMNLYMKNHWTKESLKGTLNLLKSKLPNPNELPGTVYSLFKYIRDHAPTPQEKVHVYCRSCQISVNIDAAECEVCNQADFGRFFQIPVDSQIRFLFEQRDLATLIETQARNVNPDANGASVITDVTDGCEYVKVKKQLKGRYDVVLLFNSDGVALSRSSKCELYPILAFPCEVPPKSRASHLLVLGVWCDSVKPDMNLFLRPFCESLKEINDNGGVSWVHPLTKQEHKSLVTAPILCADAPARAIMLNVKQYNSKYGCNICEQKAKKVNLGASVRARRCFVFQEDEAPLRSGERMDRQGILAEQNKKSVYGVKGKAVVSKIPFLDRGLCASAEYLHNLLLGAVKYFTNIMINKRGRWYIGNNITEIDNFIENSVKVPDYLNRCPRGLSKLKFWKASEFRCWLLFLSLPALKNYLPDEYFQHWLLLVAASYCLLRDNISDNDLARARVMLRCFVRDVGSLYGNDCYTYNVHNLLHLPLLVKRWGPLWATSAFIFETMNGYLRDLLHGTKNLGQELANNLRLCLGLQVLQNYVQGSIPKFSIEKQPQNVSGIPVSFTLLTNAEPNLLAESGIGDQFVLYSRVKQNFKIFTSKSYDYGKRRCNSCVRISGVSNAKYGQILYFVRNSCNGMLHCIVQEYAVEHTSIFFHTESLEKITHMIPVVETESLVLIPIKEIESKLIKVGKYLCVRPNSYEVNL